jgi:hypothetical protein
MSFQRYRLICPWLEFHNIVKALFRKFWHWKRINLVILGKYLERRKALARQGLTRSIRLIRKTLTTGVGAAVADVSPPATGGPRRLSAARLAFRFCFFARSLSEKPAKNSLEEVVLTHTRNETGGVGLFCRAAETSFSRDVGAVKSGPVGRRTEPHRGKEGDVMSIQLAGRPRWLQRATILALGGLLALCVGNSAAAHDQWANGDPVPAWVKQACCGPDDVHHLTRDQVHETADGWRVDGYPDIIPIGTEQPSPDGDYWIFYRTLPNGDKTRVYCFFTPFQGT